MRKFTDFVQALQEKDKGEYDQEGSMSKGQLRTMIDAAQSLHDSLEDDENMPEWVQSKITKATDYIDTARDYMMSRRKGLDENAAKALEKLSKTGGIDQKDFKKAHDLYKNRKLVALKKFIKDLDTEPSEAIAAAIMNNDSRSFNSMYPRAKAGQYLRSIIMDEYDYELEEGSETWEAGYKRRVVKTSKPEHKEKGYNWRIKGKDKAHLTIKLYKEKPSQSEFNKQMKRVAGHEFGG